MNTSSHVDVIVVGLGIHGSATASHLARRGVRVAGIEQFAPVHARGSSHGRTRMIRRAYPNPVWNDLVDRAFTGWAQLEERSGQRMLHRTGGLYAHAGESQLQGADCVLVSDPRELHDRMPGLRVPDGYRAVFDPSAGVVEAERAVRALQSEAAAAGADLRFEDRMLGWDAIADGVEVRTESGVLRASRIVFTVGSWVAQTFPRFADLIEVWRILTLTVAPGQPAGMPPALGALSIDRPEGLMFGIPDADGNGVKIGVDAGEIWDPDVPVAAPTDAEIAHFRELFGRYLPDLDSTPVEAAACLYTMTDDKRFIVGALPDAPEVIVASACSGHGFKFGPAIGEALADLAVGIERPDLDFISVARRGSQR
ncbi:N-methyl-L-tryptophan oxidase [Microbacterium sediminicola]|uniref:N-methyl-L-tryptophan oxidase n=1 Tax=Microbacterium sediminicola TaxID=415210 RepID=A0ABP4TGU8_9MICO